MQDIARPHSHNSGTTEAHSLLPTLSRRSTCPNSFQKFPFCPPTTTSRLNPHFLSPSPAQRRRDAGGGSPDQRDAVPPTPRRGPPLAATRGAVLRLARAARPSRIRHGDHVGSPGRGPNSAPARCRRRPPRVWPRPAAFPGRPCPLPPFPQLQKPLHSGGWGSGRWGSPRRGLGSSARSLGVAAAPLPARPQLNPFPPAEGSRPGGSSRDAVAFGPLHHRPRSPRPATSGLRTSDPPRLGGAGTGLAAAAAGRAEGGPRSLLLPPRGRGERGGGGAGAAGPGELRPHSDPGPQSWVGGGLAPNWGEGSGPSWRNRHRTGLTPTEAPPRHRA